MKKRDLGDEVIQGLADAVVHQEGKITLKTTSFEIPDFPPAMSKAQISRIRTEILRMSQGAFAAFLGVSPAVIRLWEQGQKKPSGARRLLQVAASDSNAILRAASFKDKKGES